MNNLKLLYSRSQITILSNHQDFSQHLLSLHGGGNSSKERSLFLAEFLEKQNTSFTSFDFSGQGESQVSIEYSSLEKRVEEARFVIENLEIQKNLSLVGSSMGAYIAVKLLEHFPEVQNLVLLCPAVYSKESFSLEFGNGFTEAIRKPESWRQSDAFEILKNYTGNLKVVIGEDDEVITQEIPLLLVESASSATSKELIQIPDCGHQLVVYLHNHQDLIAQLFR